MIELRLHRELYDGPAVDEAAKLYREYGSVDLAEEAAYWVVRVGSAAEPAGDGATDAADLGTLAAELSNYALGLTIERRTGARGGAS